MQIKEQVSPHVSPLVLKASAEMTTPSVKWLLPLYCSLHVLCWMFLLFSFCFVWNKITIFNMHHIIKAKMNVIDITYVFLLLLCPYRLCLLQKKSCQYFMNNAWALPMFNLFFSQFSFQNLIMKPFCISHMLSTLFFFWKKSLLIYYIQCCYKHVGIKTQFLLVSSVLVHVWMSDSMLDSQCNIYTSLSSLECSNSSLEVHKVFSLKTMMQ